MLGILTLMTTNVCCNTVLAPITTSSHHQHHPRHERLVLFQRNVVRHRTLPTAFLIIIAVSNIIIRNKSNNSKNSSVAAHVRCQGDLSRMLALVHRLRPHHQQFTCCYKCPPRRTVVAEGGFTTTEKPNPVAYADKKCLHPHNQHLFSSQRER